MIGGVCACLFAAIMPLWPQGKIPLFDPDQIAAPLAEADAPDFDRAAHRMPYLEWHQPPAKPNGAVMILVSGGGYRNTSSGPSLAPLREMLVDCGVTCVSLWYRTPRPRGLPVYASAWADAQRAVRLVRAEARRRGLDPERIGALGSSAGAHLSLLLGTSALTSAYAPVDDADGESAHLNWVIAMCPAFVLADGLEDWNEREGDEPGLKVDPVFRFDAKTCPMCFFHGGDDRYSPLGTTRLYRELRRRKIAAEIHLDPARGHGTVSPALFERALEFMRQLGFLGVREPEVPLMTRFADDGERGEYVRRELWPAVAMPQAQTNQCMPYLEWHLPKTLKTKAIQIVFSGGGYKSNTVDDYEVAPIRRYLNAKGMTVVTLKYRTPRPEGLPRYLSAWQDLSRAVRIVRAEAPARGLDPERIGIMGSSAGGHLAVLGATSSRRRIYRPVDEIDRCSAKVAWAVAMYPAYLLDDGVAETDPQGGDDDERLAPEFSFDLDTAPILFLHGDVDDWATPMGSVTCWEQLRRMGIGGELHTLATRWHSFQRTASPGTGSYNWMDRVWDFLKRTAL